jgi:hypothetical protein
MQNVHKEDNKTLLKEIKELKEKRYKLHELEGVHF